MTRDLKQTPFFVYIVRFFSTEKYRLYSTKKGQIVQALKKELIAASKVDPGIIRHETDVRTLLRLQLILDNIS